MEPSAEPVEAAALGPLLQAIAQAPRPTRALRLFHGRGGLHPGCEALSLDAYPPAWLLTSHAPVDPDALQAIDTALRERWALLSPGEPLIWLFQLRDGVRADNRLMAGTLPEPHRVDEDGARFEVHLARGLNHGLFLDMAGGRRWVRDWALAHPGGRVLNLFAYTCAFSVVALQAGAGAVLNLDMAAGALAIGKRNHALNGLSAGAHFLPHDLFSSWGRVARSGPYDLVIADPPTHQAGSFRAEKDYARVVRRLPGLLAPGGQALLCLNSPKLGPDFVHGLVAAEAPGLRFIERVANPAAFADRDEARSLKVLAYRLGD